MINYSEKFEKMRIAGNLAAKTLDMLTDHIKLGISTDYIDKLGYEFIRDHGGYSAPLFYRGFQKSLCTSLNHVVCHGIPSDRILEEGLYHYYPKTRGKVTYCEVGSPLTFNHYIGSQRGEVYGLDNKPIRFQHDDWLIPKTHIEGLYLTGQDITTLGITGAMMAGVLSAHSVLGYGTITDLISGRNLIEDIQNLE